MQGKSIVFIPGLLCTGDLFGPQIDVLKRSAQCLIANHTKQNDIKEIAASILDNAPADFDLVGLSMGGYIALEIMRQAPERVIHLVLLDTSARPDTEEQSKKRQQFIKLAGFGKFKGVTRHLLPMLVHPDRLEDTDLSDTIYRMAEEVGREAFIRQQEAVMGRPDSRPGLARINCPVLVIVGGQDAITPVSHAVEIAEAIPQARLEVIESCGHLSTLEQPEAVTQLLQDHFR